MNNIIALPYRPATARHILPLEDTRQAAHHQRRNIMPEPAAAPVVPPTVFRKGLLLHCGAEVVDRRTLSRVETPSCTESWFPIPHDFLLKEVESQFAAHGFGIGETTHALSHEGKRYFGVLQILRPDDGPGDYRGSSAFATPMTKPSRPPWSWERASSSATILPSPEK